MDFKIFFKKDFLRLSFDDFVKKIENSDYKNFKSVLKENKARYIPGFLFNLENKTIQSLFNVVDKTRIKNNPEYKEDKILQREELYEWVKKTYKLYMGKDITDEELKNMKMSEFMKNVDSIVSKDEFNIE